MIRNATSTWLILASLGFWISWLLMPGVGVTNPERIFALVREHRPEVHASVALQLLSAIGYLLGAFGLALGEPSARPVRLGCILLAIGAAGSAADAIFHLVAYEMTAPGVPTAALTAVMARLQGADLRLLLPFVAAFFAGHAVLAIAFRARGAPGRLAFRLLLAAPVLALVCGVLARGGALPKRATGLVFLGLLSASLIAVALAGRGDRGRQSATR